MTLHNQPIFKIKLRIPLRHSTFLVRHSIFAFYSPSFPIPTQNPNPNSQLPPIKILQNLMRNPRPRNLKKQLLRLPNPSATLRTNPESQIPAKFVLTEIKFLFLSCYPQKQKKPTKRLAIKKQFSPQRHRVFCCFFSVPSVSLW